MAFQSSSCPWPGVTPSEVAAALTTHRSRFTLARKTVPAPESRAVLFGFSLADEAADEFVASIRRYLPIELVAAIRINGREYGPLG